MQFRDRRDAGRGLAHGLLGYRGRGSPGPPTASLDVAPPADAGPVVVALPRGGVIVGAEVASALDAPLDVLVVRKLGHPLQPELAIGAIAEGGVIEVDWVRALRTGVSAAELQRVAADEWAELDRRVQRYRAGRPPITVAGRTVLLVDDGLATGSTARVAITALRSLGAREVVLAVPVAPADVAADLRRIADDLVAVAMPLRFGAVGEWYDDFSQVGDEEVTDLLESLRRSRPPAVGR